MNGFSLVLKIREVKGTYSVHTFFVSEFFLFATESAWLQNYSSSRDVVFIVISCLFLKIFAILETSQPGIVSDVCHWFHVYVLTFTSVCSIEIANELKVTSYFRNLPEFFCTLRKRDPCYVAGQLKRISHLFNYICMWLYVTTDYILKIYEWLPISSGWFWSFYSKTMFR